LITSRRNHHTIQIRTSLHFYHPICISDCSNISRLNLFGIGRNRQFRNTIYTHLIVLLERIIDDFRRELCKRFNFISIHLLKIRCPCQCECLHIFCEALHDICESLHVVCEDLHVVCEALHVICETRHLTTVSRLFSKIQLHLTCEALHFPKSLSLHHKKNRPHIISAVYSSINLFNFYFQLSTQHS